MKCKFTFQRNSFVLLDPLYVSRAVWLCRAARSSYNAWRGSIAARLVVEMNTYNAWKFNIHIHTRLWLKLWHIKLHFFQSEVVNKATYSMIVTGATLCLHFHGFQIKV